jgi:hypothetical protein
VAELLVELGTRETHRTKLGIETVESTDNRIHIKETGHQKIIVRTEKTGR